MVVWTYGGYFASDEGSKELLEKTISRINERIIKSHEKITINQMYKEFFGGIYYSTILYPFKNLEGEFFIDPDLWGWDEKGFRQLYRIKKIREEL